MAALARQEAESSSAEFVEKLAVAEKALAEMRVSAAAKVAEVERVEAACKAAEERGQESSRRQRARKTPTAGSDSSAAATH